MVAIVLPHAMPASRQAQCPWQNDVPDLAPQANSGGAAACPLIGYQVPFPLHERLSEMKKLVPREDSSFSRLGPGKSGPWVCLELLSLIKAMGYATLHHN